VIVEQQDAAAVMVQWVERYGPAAGEEGPVRLVREVFGVDPDEWQEEVLRDFGRGTRRISIRSCHGPGKTCLVAWMVWCMLLTRFPQKTVATAPTRGQLFDGLFAEVETWGKRLPPQINALYNHKSDRIELLASPSESFFTARTARAETPEALQGIHSDHVLLIADEASGVAEPIFEAGSGSMSGESCQTVLLGNPVRTSGFFFESHNRLSHMWKTYHIRAAGAEWPSGIPSYRVADDYVREQAALYGDDSNAYRIRVLGEFPASDEDTVIPFSLVESARMRELELPKQMPEVWGLDVARFGSARNALVGRNKRAVTSIEVWDQVDLMQTAGRVYDKYHQTAPFDRPKVILVDIIGMGAGVVDRLLELKLPVRGVNASETAGTTERFMRARDELWWKGRDWLAGNDVMMKASDDIAVAEIELLAQELCGPRYAFTSSGKIKVEGKDEMRKRGLRSPDVADAFILTFAEDLSILTGEGLGGGFGWSAELPSRTRGIP
jgi:hypothetical protein